MTEPTPDPLRGAREEFAKTGVSRAQPSAPGEQTGDVIDRYKLLQSIGEGGMGTVWMAEQKEPVKRQVALKIIKLGMDTKEVVVRFEAERQALALMDHANIAKVLDGGATAQGRPFFVMELVRGVPITQYCDEQKLGIRARLELFTKVCEAIQHAHHKGIIHRDIKPSNVMVTMHDGVPVPKVIDFGIAKATSVELTQKTLFTQYGNMIGTPEYMAPEQAEMSGLDIDTRADVYSLGVLLYELLTGSKPFEITKVLEKGYQELLRTIREDQPAKPSTRVSTMGEQTPIARAHANVGKLSSRLRGDLDWIVMRALEKDRTRRYETANGFAADVSRYLKGEAVHAAPPSSAYRLRKFLARRRKTVIAAATIAFLFVAGSVGTGIGWWEAHKANTALIEANDDTTRALALEVKQRRRAEAAEQAERLRANELEQATSFHESLFYSLTPHEMGRGLRKALLASIAPDQRDAVEESLRGVNFTDLSLGRLEADLLAPSLEAIEERFADQPAVQIRLLLSIGRGLVAFGRYEGGLRFMERILAQPKAVQAAHPIMLVKAKALAASALGGLERWEECDALAREAERYCREHDVPPLLLADVLTARGTSLTFRIKYVEAEPLYAEAIRVLANERDESSVRTATAATISIMSIMSQLGRHHEAEQLARTTLADLEGRKSVQANELISVRLALGMAMHRGGKSQDAVEILKEAYEKSSAWLGAEARLTIETVKQYVDALLKTNQRAEAEPVLLHGLAAARRAYTDDSEVVRTLEGAYGMLLYKQGRLEEAEKVADRVIEMIRAGDAAGREMELISALSSRASTLATRGKLAEAEDAYRDLLDLCDGVGQNAKRQKATALQGLGAVLRKRGKLKEAVPTLREALAASQEALGADHPDVDLCRTSLAVALQASGRRKEAAPIFEAILANRIKTYGRDHLQSVLMMINVAASLDDDPDRAIAMLLEVYEVLPRHVGTRHPFIVVAGSRLASIYVLCEQWAKAEPLLRESLQLSRGVFGDLHPETAVLANLLGRVVFREDAAAGRKLLAEGIATLDQLNPPAARGARKTLATLELEHGDASEAERLIDAILELRAEAYAGDWRLADAQIIRFAAIGRQGRAAEVEAGLVKAAEQMIADTGREGMKVDLPKRYTPKVLRHVVAFYEHWHDADPSAGADAKAARWRERIAGLGQEGK